ncbi:hypothetical protein [Pseudomonas citrulli]|uniref:Uncharacterized protein n=1 Tax=Pseudomonas citrulli TaxID=3064347 RepID=A0ABT9BZW7_9PSED|nr:hypothetical protein [Pseudomonas sp. K18]MDO7896878.1 hypothetical protein [Pseudomonas sp. K18]
MYVMVMTICTGVEGCVEERRHEPTYATKAMCMETASHMAARKGVKLKCRSERSWAPSTAPGANGLERVVSTDVKGQP